MNGSTDTSGAVPDWARRLEALEEKACYADDMLEVLNATVIRQQAEIEQLRLALLAWRAAASGGNGPETRSLRDELPPHY